MRPAPRGHRTCASERVRRASDSAYRRRQAAIAFFGLSPSGGGTQQLSSTPTWPALAAASLTSVDGQRDPCIIPPDLAAYAREGDDLGSAQSLTVLTIDFGGGASVRPRVARRRAADKQSSGHGSSIRAIWTPRTDSVWNFPTRSRDGTSSSDDNSDTGQDHPDRDRGATPPRTTADSPCAVRAQSRSHVVPIF